MQPTPPPTQFDGQLPAAMSIEAAGVDSLYYFIYWFSVVFTVAITAATLYFVWKYKRKAGVPFKAAKELHIDKLEIFWTVTPVVFIVWLFHVGFASYIRNAVAHEGALEIRVRGSQWRWEFEYPNGLR